MRVVCCRRRIDADVCREFGSRTVGSLRHDECLRNLAVVAHKLYVGRTSLHSVVLVYVNVNRIVGTFAHLHPALVAAHRVLHVGFDVEAECTLVTIDALVVWRYNHLERTFRQCVLRESRHCRERSHHQGSI